MHCTRLLCIGITVSITIALNGPCVADECSPPIDAPPLAFYCPRLLYADREACESAPSPGVDWACCNKVGTLQTSRGIDLRGADLRWASLSHTDLSNAVLDEANLDEANFSLSIAENASLRCVSGLNASFELANLAGADMSGASLISTYLVAAFLENANLANADLTGANLTYANLTGANLAGARLDGAVLDEAIWVDGRICAKESLGTCR